MKLIIILSFSFLFSLDVFSRDAVSASRYQLLSGIRKDKEEKEFWDQRYNDQKYIYGKAPAKFLSRNYHFLPQGGKVLDLGMGEGRNAVFLARKGYKVTGLDISPMAIKKAKSLAREFKVRIDTILASAKKAKIKPESFDAIICFYFVDRSIKNLMLSWLRPGGILIYESHTMVQKEINPQNNYEDEFLLKKGELLTMFPDSTILKYEEPLHMKEFTASIIVKK